MPAIDEPVSALAFCWRLERRDGAGLALTSHDRPLSRDGDTYLSDPGILPASVSRSIGLEASNGEVAGALSSDAIAEQDLLLGRWDGARVTLTATDWNDGGVGAVPIIAGELGEIGVRGDRFEAELHGAASRLDAPICPSTSPECRAQLGDKRCRVDLSGRSERLRVIDWDGTAIRVDRPVDETIVFGRLRYLSGDNCGASTVVLAVAGDRLTLRDLPRADLVAGDTILVRQGCDKRLATCIDRFSNAANFRGEPHLPGNDLLTRYPGA